MCPSVETMGFGKNLGGFAGTLAGGVIRLGTEVVGGVTGSKFIKEVGEAAEAVTIRTGETVGRAVDGVGGTVRGIVKGDDAMTKAGVEEVGGAVADTAKGVASGVVTVCKDGKSVYTGLKTGDKALAAAAGRNLAKTAAVSFLAIGILETIDVVDLDGDAVEAPSDPAMVASTVVGISDGGEIVSSADIPGLPEGADPDDFHYVRPHYVSGYETEDGTWVGPVWRDGASGNGYLAGNPDGDPSNNLRPS